MPSDSVVTAAPCVHIQRLAGAPGVELLSLAPAVSRDRLLRRKLTLLLFQTVIFVRQIFGFWFLVNSTRFAMPGRVLFTTTENTDKQGGARGPDTYNGLIFL